jgi:hypothetical protein
MGLWLTKGDEDAVRKVGVGRRKRPPYVGSQWGRRFAFACQPNGPRRLQRSRCLFGSGEAYNRFNSAILDSTTTENPSTCAGV